MNNKTFLTTHPEVYKKLTETSVTRPLQLQENQVSELAASLIEDQKIRIRQFEVQISAYKVQIDAEKKNTVDHRPYVETVEREISQIRNEELYINEQISNCQLVEGQVTPMEYYLWKKKQRINTFDASIAELCRAMEEEHEHIQASIEEGKRESEDLTLQIEKLEERIAQMNSAENEISASGRSRSGEFESLEELEKTNAALKEEYADLSRKRQFLQENRDIVAMQISDNIRSIQSSLKSYFQIQKSKLVQEFKQIQADSKTLDVRTPVTAEEINYRIDPLLADYTYKLKELSAATPESMKKIVVTLLQPLAWDKFYWQDFLEIDPKSTQICTQFKRLQSQYIELNNKNEKLKEEINNLSQEFLLEAEKSSRLSENIQKLRKKLKK